SAVLRMPRPQAASVDQNDGTVIFADRAQNPGVNTSTGATSDDVPTKKRMNQMLHLRSPTRISRENGGRPSPRKGVGPSLPRPVRGVPHYYARTTTSWVRPIIASEPPYRVAVHIDETHRRGPRVHESPHRLGRSVAAEDDLAAAVAVGDDAEVGDSVPNRGLRQLRHEGIAHVSNRRPCTEVDARSLAERRASTLHVGKELFG